MQTNDKILVTGASGLLGSAIVSELESIGYSNILIPAHKELDLLESEAVDNWFKKNKPDYVYHLASLVYGLKGNLDNQHKSIHQNTQINLNILGACANYSVKKIFFAGTVASYPFPYPSLPLEEKFFLNGEPHAGEYGYAIAKRHALAYLKILKETKNMDYCYGIFTNMYGINDKYDVDGGHVVPALIKKALDAMQTDEKSLMVWGNKDTTRDFLNSKDAAHAAILCMQSFIGAVNIASGESISIETIVKTIDEFFEHKLEINWDLNAPIGVPQRSVNIDKLKSIGFDKQVSLKEGIFEAINWAQNPKNTLRIK
jgi:GDP-L-fucose synthase